jgi:pimeloyl-ACP methyl ester carboxylesterase
MLLSKRQLSAHGRSDRPSLPAARTVQLGFELTRRKKSWIIGLAAWGIIIGCTDSVAPRPTVPSDISRMQVCDTAPDCSGPGGGINPNDSWVSGDVGITTSATDALSSPIYDEATGQMQSNFTTFATENLHVDAGYGYSHQTIVNTAYTDPVDPATSASIQVTNAGLNADVLTESNYQSQQIQDVSASDATAETPMHIVGSTQNGDVTAGAIVDLADTTTVQSSSITAAGAGSYRTMLADAAAKAERGSPQTVKVAGGAITVALIKGNTLQVTDTIDSGVSAADNNASSKHFSIYNKVGHLWLLAEIHTEIDAQDTKHKLHQEQVMRLKHLRFFRNREADAARRALRPTTEWIPLPPSNGTVSAMLVVCGDECNGGSSYVAGPSPIGPTPPCSYDVVTNVNPGGPLNILYQHGLMSTATTWCGSPSMDDYLRSRFVVGNEIRHTLASTDYYENQTSALTNLVRNDAASYPGPYTFIGHSNGGIVSRATAQNLVYQGNYVQGVITVSSPQAGAALAKVGKSALSAALAVPLLASKIACNLVSHIVCTIAKDLHGDGSNGLTTILDQFINQSGAVLSEMTPNNPYYANLNAGSEPFPRAAVIDQAWDKWTEWRLLGDWTVLCPTLYSGCDGRHVVATIDKTYHRYLKCAVIGGIFGFFIPGAGTVAFACAASAANLKGWDLIYKRLSVGNDHGDGVVAVHSQRYPNLDTGGQFMVLDSDSHLGSTRSILQTGPQIANGINQRIGISFAQ